MNLDIDNGSKDGDTFSVGTHLERRIFLPRLDLGSLRGRNHKNINEEQEDKII